MKKAFIHVNQPRIRSNLKSGATDPVITVKSYNSNDYGNNAVITCPQCSCEVAEVKYQPLKPLSCGARVWIEVADRESVRVRE